MRRQLGWLVAGGLLAGSVAACGGDDGGDGPTAVSYWLWDANQQAAYQQCADDFEAEHPEITIQIEQYGWGDYWEQLSIGLAAETAPDVFTNHLSRYPQLAADGQLLPLNDLVAQGGVDDDAYFGGLSELWVTQDGSRYGLPKDWDAVAIFYNQEMVADAGISEEEMQNLTWNPDDGGSYEEVIAKLTVDENGVRGDEPEFDPDNVEVYGLGLSEAGGAVGQTQWSMYAASNGWQFLDENPWGTQYHYDDPRLHEALSWWRGLIDKGYMPTLEVATSGVSVFDAFGAGRSAMNTNGSWLLGTYLGYEDVEVGLAPTPIGPDGQRASMFNGLADSIWAGSPDQEQAWEWVRYLASVECQTTIGEAGVVFPAIPEALTVAEQTFAEQEVALDAFTVHIEEESTFLYPVTDHFDEVSALVEPVMDSFMLFEAEPADLVEVNDQVNALFDGS